MPNMSKCAVTFVVSWKPNIPPRNGADHRVLTLLRACEQNADVTQVVLKSFLFVRPMVARPNSRHAGMDMDAAISRIRIHIKSTEWG